MDAISSKIMKWLLKGFIFIEKISRQLLIIFKKLDQNAEIFNHFLENRLNKKDLKNQASFFSNII